VTEIEDVTRLAAVQQGIIMVHSEEEVRRRQADLRKGATVPGPVSREAADGRATVDVSEKLKKYLQG